MLKQNDNIFSIGDTSHGTHVAGLAIASQNNFKGTSELLQIVHLCLFKSVVTTMDFQVFLL